jgi:hypothetical protein
MINSGPFIRYFGWSALSIEVEGAALFFDPFYRPYCNARWFGLADFAHAKVICVTHGHEEHFLDTPELARHTGATVVASGAVCNFLRRRNGISRERLMPIRVGETREVMGFRISTFNWKHRDINLPKALTRALFQGNTTQLAWAWSSAINAPFYSAYTGFHVELPSGLTILNYNEGFNSKLTDAELDGIRARFRTDVLLAGMQLDFVDDVARGAAALAPRMVVLYPPHEKFHEMMGASSRPWSEFADAVRARLPHAEIVVANPGTLVDTRALAVLSPRSVPRQEETR